MFHLFSNRINHTTKAVQFPHYPKNKEKNFGSSNPSGRSSFENSTYTRIRTYTVFTGEMDAYSSSKKGKPFSRIWNLSSTLLNSHEIKNLLLWIWLCGHRILFLCSLTQKVPVFFCFFFLCTKLQFIGHRNRIHISSFSTFSFYIYLGLKFQGL